MGKVVPILKNSVGPVESGVPMPKPRTRTVYPFATMKVGQSFTVPREMQQKVASAAAQWAGRHPPAKFAIRGEGDRARVWRVK